MEDYKDLDKEIKHLKSIVSGGMFFDSKSDWKSIWSQIKKIGTIFQGVRYPTKEEHKHAWNEYQVIIEEVKLKQSKEHELWNKKKFDSETMRDSIITQANKAHIISNNFADIILTLATGGVNLILESILGPFDERKKELLYASKQLRRGWDLLKEYKDDMLGRDKKEAFSALNNAKENLDIEWAEYKRERQRASDNYIQEKEQRKSARRERIESNIDKLEAKRGRLTDVLYHKESHLDDLRNKLSNAGQMIIVIEYQAGLMKRNLIFRILKISYQI